MMDNLASDEANLELKVEKKKQDLERNQKRLKSLANVRPAFMDEYERLEVDLAKQYHVYMEKHCNLSYLEHLMDQHHKVEQGKMEVGSTHLWSRVDSLVWLLTLHTAGSGTGEGYNRIT